MKSMVSQLIVLTAALLLSTHSRADSDIRHDSKVDGVSLFWLFLDEEIPSDLLVQNDAATIESHCDGKNKIFIYELGSKGFLCKARDLHTDFYEHRAMIDIIGMGASDRVGAPHLDGYQGIYTVSTQPISKKNWEAEPIPTSLVLQLQELSKGECLEQENSCQSLTGTKLDKQIVGVDLNFEPSDIQRLALRIKGASKELFIVPSAVGAGAADAWAIRSSVFAKSGESYELVGRFWGSLIRLGADIDNDGIPELIIDNSTPGLSQEIYCYKIYPTVEYLISYNH